ncbi:unnamed protein product, partial [Ixodes hexagonus]
ILGVVGQSPLGSESGVPGSPQQAERTLAEDEQELRQWCFTPTGDKIPSPLSLQPDAAREPLEPGAAPSDTSYEEDDFTSSDEEMCAEPDRLGKSYGPDDSNSGDGDSSDTSTWSNDSVMERMSSMRPLHGVCNSSSAEVNPVKETKYLVSASQLLLLFSVCVNCLAPTRTKLTHRGTLVHALITCARGHKTVWENQPRVNSKALQHSAACCHHILWSQPYAGSSPPRLNRRASPQEDSVLPGPRLFGVPCCYKG